ncbi:hypothetical protein [Streptomyces sp. NPDC054849]
MESWQCSPSAITTPQLTLDPYRFPGAEMVESMPCDTSPQMPGDPNANTLPSRDEENPRVPRQASHLRLTWSLQPSDRRRLDLHAALTAAGIPPLPGDLAAIRTLSSLDDTTHAALVRWINTSR